MAPVDWDPRDALRDWSGRKELATGSRYVLYNLSRHVRLCSILGRLVQCMNSGSPKIGKEDLAAELQEWSKDLPDELADLRDLPDDLAAESAGSSDDEQFLSRGNPRREWDFRCHLQSVYLTVKILLNRLDKDPSASDCAVLALSLVKILKALPDPNSNPAPGQTRFDFVAPFVAYAGQTAATVFFELALEGLPEAGRGNDQGGCDKSAVESGSDSASNSGPVFKRRRLEDPHKALTKWGKKALHALEIVQNVSMFTIHYRHLISERLLANGFNSETRKDGTAGGGPAPSRDLLAVAPETTSPASESIIIDIPTYPLNDERPPEPLTRDDRHHTFAPAAASPASQTVAIEVPPRSLYGVSNLDISGGSMLPAWNEDQSSDAPSPPNMSIPSSPVDAKNRDKEDEMDVDPAPGGRSRAYEMDVDHGPGGRSRADEMDVDLRPGGRSRTVELTSRTALLSVRSPTSRSHLPQTQSISGSTPQPRNHRLFDESSVLPRSLPLPRHASPLEDKLPLNVAAHAMSITSIVDDGRPSVDRTLPNPSVAASYRPDLHHERPDLYPHQNPPNGRVRGGTGSANTDEGHYRYGERRREADSESRVGFNMDATHDRRWLPLTRAELPHRVDRRKLSSSGQSSAQAAPISFSSGTSALPAGLLTAEIYFDGEEMEIEAIPFDVNYRLFCDKNVDRMAHLPIHGRYLLVRLANMQDRPGRIVNAATNIRRIIEKNVRFSVEIKRTLPAEPLTAAINFDGQLMDIDDIPFDITYDLFCQKNVDHMAHPPLTAATSSGLRICKIAESISILQKCDPTMLLITTDERVRVDATSNIRKMIEDKVGFSVEVILAPPAESLTAEIIFAGELMDIDDIPFDVNYELFCQKNVDHMAHLPFSAATSSSGWRILKIAESISMLQKCEPKMLRIRTGEGKPVKLVHATTNIRRMIEKKVIFSVEIGEKHDARRESLPGPLPQTQSHRKASEVGDDKHYQPQSAYPPPSQFVAGYHNKVPPPPGSWPAFATETDGIKSPIFADYPGPHHTASRNDKAASTFPDKSRPRGQTGYGSFYPGHDIAAPPRALTRDGGEVGSSPRCRCHFRTAGDRNGTGRHPSLLPLPPLLHPSHIWLPDASRIESGSITPVKRGLPREPVHHFWRSPLFSFRLIVFQGGGGGGACPVQLRYLTFPGLFILFRPFGFHDDGGHRRGAHPVQLGYFCSPG
ncbi:hypothetical protein BDK51DRAFT_40342 [Blyttiomyces helicus]|uniref:Uncharacterized protein n=1 Tax=Blyttiomyces helicus TaxID=388810 RepID=A0A4P9WCI1_9FUNG|nr:hypothetical protein BDK51DRAFT_40342 [Blyttiomyces helicus]|eukprot:RKO89313.1 hypothetical protein BDK51DRAFT_40342 [Blyttiomyces helicus]